LSAPDRHRPPGDELVTCDERRNVAPGSRKPVRLPASTARMTKALSCSRCTTIRTFLSDGQITTCECGTVKGWWLDAPKGVARLYTESLMGRHFGRIVGFHNQFLQRAHTLDKPVPDGFHRNMHDRSINAPGYLFDQTRRGCWAVVILPGESSDTRW